MGIIENIGDHEDSSGWVVVLQPTYRFK